VEKSMDGGESATHTTGLLFAMALSQPSTLSQLLAPPVAQLHAQSIGSMPYCMPPKLLPKLLSMLLLVLVLSRGAFSDGVLNMSTMP
jgi:hypothetical protein